MFTVYIIEDNVQFAKKTSDIIHNYSDRFKDFNVSNLHVCSTDFKKFLNSIPKVSSHKNIYILDIELGSTITGIEIAKLIRQFDFDGYIIFLTAHEEFTGKVLSYNLKAVNYINKNKDSFIMNLNNSLARILYETTSQDTSSSKTISKIANYENAITFSYKGASHKVLTDDILYVETHPLRRCLNIYLKDSIIEYRETLNNIIEDLPSNFIRCHKSYIINISKVKKIHLDQQNYIAFMTADRSCPISKRFVDKPLDLLIDYNNH